MASSYSTNLALELPATGEKAGTWGTITNTNLGTLIEQAISGYTTTALTSDADATITIPNGATGQARNMYIEIPSSLTLTANRTLTVPANKKLYFVYNNSAGGFSVTLKVSGQTGITVPNGKKMLLVCNGTDVYDAVTNMSSLSVNNAAVTTASNTQTLTNKTLTSPVISGGTIDNAIIGATTAAAATVTNLTFSGSSRRITADFSSTAASTALRASFQTSTVDGSTFVTALPNGTGTTSQFVVFNNSDPVAVGGSHRGSLAANSNGIDFVSAYLLSGTAQTPPTGFKSFYFKFSSSVAAQIDPDGTFTCGLYPSATGGLVVSGVASSTRSVTISGATAGNDPTIGTSAGNLKVSAPINLTSGQIAFPAVQVPSSDANTLDDYEEGTWSPTLTCTTPGTLSVSYSGLNSAYYTKVGRLVSISIRLSISTMTKGTASGQLSIPLPSAIQSSALIMGGVSGHDLNLLTIGGGATTGFTQLGVGGGSGLNIYASGVGKTMEILNITDLGNSAQSIFIFASYSIV